MRILCYTCGKSVSTEVPDSTIVRAWIECPECIKKQYHNLNVPLPMSLKSKLVENYDTQT
jgi:DNA-directed RNA polymerase subunit RPC12/RpoP